METRKSISSLMRAGLLFGLFSAATALAANNNSPPSGAILDLGGGETATASLAINQGMPTVESVAFTASLSGTDITLAIRDDPAYVYIYNVSLVDNTTSSGNLLVNGDFSGATYTSNGNSSTPVGWTFANVYGASFIGFVDTGCLGYATSCWADGSTQAYDAIDQVVATNPGDMYTLSFGYTEDSGQAFFSDLSTNGQPGTGGNGIDILAYAQAGLPEACAPGIVCTNNAPEPGSTALIAVALAAMGLVYSRRKQV